MSKDISWKRFGSNTMAGVILAAGRSIRMGRAKQLLKVGNETILSIVIRAALESGLDEVILVLGYKAKEIKESLASLLDHIRLEVIQNDQFEKGLSSSLIAGLNVVEGRHSAVMFILGDQPFIKASHINFLIKGYLDSDCEICVPLYRGEQGHPVIFSHKMFPELRKIRGDMGGRRLIINGRKRVLKIEMDEPDSIIDIDTLEDYERLLNLQNRG